VRVWIWVESGWEEAVQGGGPDAISVSAAEEEKESEREIVYVCACVRMIERERKGGREAGGRGSRK
jgi:hypothetical protein